MAITTVVKTEQRSVQCYRRTFTDRYALQQTPPGGNNPYALHPTDSSTSVSLLGSTKDRDDVKTWKRDSLFFEKVRLHQPLPENSFDFVRRWRFPGKYISAETSVTNHSGSWYKQQVTDDSQWYADWIENPSDLPWVTTHAQLQAKLLRKQRGDHWEAPVFLAEAGRTAQMVTQRAGDLVNLLRHLRRGDARQFLLGLRNTLSSGEMSRTLRTYNRDRKINGVRRSGANLWLESWYGWVPFVSDVYDAFTTLQSLSDLDHAMVGVTRAKVWSKIDRIGFDGTEISGSEAVRYYSPYSESRTGVWRWKPTDFYIPAKLGLLNPLSVAWEVLPFSFVADWFIPIGSWIDTLDAPLRAEHVGGSYGTKREWITTEVLRKKSSTDPKSYSGFSRARQLYIHRTAMSAMPHPGLALLRLKTGQGRWHVATATALLTQTMGWFTKDSKTWSGLHDTKVKWKFLR